MEEVGYRVGDRRDDAEQRDGIKHCQLAHTLQLADYSKLGAYIGQIHSNLFSFTQEKEITKTPLLDLPYKNMAQFELENAKNLIAIIEENEDDRDEDTPFNLLTSEEQLEISNMVQLLFDALQTTSTQNLEEWCSTGLKGVIHRDMRLEHFLFSTENIELIDWSFARWGFYLEDLSRVILEFEMIEEAHLEAFISSYNTEFSEVKNELSVLPTLIRLNAIRGGSWALNRLLQPITPDLKITKKIADVYLELFTKMTFEDNANSLKQFFETI